MNRYGIFWLAYLIVLLLAAGHAFGHGDHHPQHRQYSQVELEWMERQYSRSDNHCCTPDELTFLEPTQWRIEEGRYQAMLRGQWVTVHERDLMRHDPDDPNPFVGEAFIFFSVYSGVPRVWCLVITDLY